MFEPKIQFETKDQALIAKVEQFISDWYTDKKTIETNTSGSTGTPKIISLQKKYMKVSAQLSGRYFKFSSDRKIVLSLSIDTIGGKMIVVRALEFNMTLVVVDVVKNPIKELNDSIYFISLVPYQLQAILDETPEKLTFIKNILLGGAPVPQCLIQQIQTLPPNFFESYGMTETMSHVAIKNLKKQNNYFEGIGNIHFNTNDKRLVIYAPELGIEQLQTNDAVEIIDETRFIWLGRTDFAINSGGIKIHPEIVEQKLEGKIPQRFFIHKEVDQLLGEKVVFVIEHPYSISILTLLKKSFSKILSTYEIPKKIYFVESFEETTSGKINRIQTFNKRNDEQ